MNGFSARCPADLFPVSTRRNGGYDSPIMNRAPDQQPAEADPGIPWAGPEREQARFTRLNFLLHLRPIRLPRESLRWTHTMGLGGSSLVLLFTLVLTGILQLLVYQPSLDGAWNSVRELESSVGFGSLVRGAHYWSANLLLLVLGLHMARVFLTGAFRGKRSTNWIIGLVLVLSVLAISFTGYLLPLDQRAWWAVTISTKMLDLIPVLGTALRELALGGDSIDEGTLVRFTTFHTTLLPIGLAGFVVWHFWRVRRAGGVILPAEANDSDRVTFFPHLFVRELAQASILVAVVLVLAAVAGAPLGDAANPGLSPNPVKAPWYFVGYQELLIHVHPMLALIILPGLSLLGALLLPKFSPELTPGGRWFLSGTGRASALAAATMAAVLTPVLILLSDRGAATREGLAASFVLPLLILGLLFGLGGFALSRWMHPRRDELIQAAVVAAVTGHIILTLAGWAFRGADMALVWPW